MKYYVVADVHGFFTPLKTALKEKGFFEDKEPHKLIILGDLFDRGNETLDLQDFVLDLMKKDEVILIRGNHEDLTLEFVKNIHRWMTPSVFYTHHGSNGTVDTVLDLTGMDVTEAIDLPEKCAARMERTPFFKAFIPAMKNYFETEKYIFVHGWIPCGVVGKGTSEWDIFNYQEDWREQGDSKWDAARWYNGMLAASKGVIEEGKTIVCGHWHCSYGHARLEGKGTEFDDGADFTPYYGKGVIGLDACTVASGKVNCIVIEDEPIE